MIIRRVLMAALLSAASFIGGYAKIGVQYQTLLGNPSNATTDASNSTNYLLARDQYTISYNDARGVANWVSWNFTTDDRGGAQRLDNFTPDPDLPPTFSVVLQTSYQGSGYDRGHMCPSADRTATRLDNDVTFYMSNMVPQAPDNNRGVWANFENYCRAVAAEGDGNEMLIICGPSLFGGSTLPSGSADIPGYVWKVVVVVPIDKANPSRPALERINADTRVIAIKIPNVAGVFSDPWQNYLVSPAVIEADTGFNFFRNLPPEIAGVLRNKIDGQTTVGLPVITAQPGFQAPALGGTATFNVSATSDTPVSYQWFKDNDDIPGATSPTLTINNVTVDDAGSYYVVVTNSVGSTTSASASLVVSGLPPVITSNPAAPATSPAGSTVTLSVGVAGSPPFNYQWLFNGAPISGANGGVLVLTNVQDGHTGAYEVLVGNGVDTVMSAAANVVVTSAAPTFVTQPASVTGTIGAAVTLTALATGTEPISYSWTHNGSPLSDSASVTGATTAILTLSDLSGSAAGDYVATASNSFGSATSGVAKVTVNAATIFWNFNTPAPTSGLPSDVSGGALSRGNTITNTESPNSLFNSSSASPSSFSGGTNAGLAARAATTVDPANTSYFEFTLTPDAGKKLVITGINFGARSTGTGPKAVSVRTNLDGFSTTVGSATLANDSLWRAITVAMPSNVTSLSGSPLTVRFYAHEATGGTQVNWRIDGLNVSVLTVSATSASAPKIVSFSPSENGSNVAVTSPITVTFDQPVNVASGWFSLSSLLNGPMAATVTGGPTTFTLTPPVGFAYGDVVTATIHGSGVTEKDTGTLTMAGNRTWSFATAVAVAPGIVAGPLSQTVSDGGTANFSVIASGSEPLSYQWRFNGAPILTNPTATTANLVISPVTPGNAGMYSVVVTNPAGSATSAGASLAVTLVAPQITTEPSPQLATVGATATFSVTATGSAPLNYQWRFNGADLENSGRVSGANSPTLSISGITPGDAGTIDVVVSNSAGTDVSQAVALGVTTATLSTAQWTFGTTAGIAGPTTPLPAFVTGGNVSHGNNNGTTTLLTTTSNSTGTNGTYPGASGSFNAGAAARLDSQTGGGLNRGTNGSAYFEFTLAGTEGRQVVVTAMSFGSRSTGTGPRNFTIYSSADGFAQPVATGSLQHNTDLHWRLITPSLSAVRGQPNGSLTFRIYGHGGAGGTPGAGTANWRIDDLSVTLGVELPPAVVATSPNAGATGVLRGAPMTVTFNQPVALAAGAFSVSSAANGSLPFTVGGGPTEYVLSPLAPFNYGDTIAVQVDASKVRDSSGTLAMTANHSFSFGTELAVPPSFTQHPQAVTTTAFEDVTFSVDVSGTGPFSYQWRRTGEDIANATGATLQLNDVLVAQSGDYDCVVKGFAGTATSHKATLTVNKAAATVTLNSLEQVYDGQPKSATVTTAPASLNVIVTYDGSPTLPINAGTYAVAATVQDDNYAGSASDTLHIAKANATILLDGLRQRYDGMPKVATATTNPQGLNVVITYHGSPDAPVLPGKHEVEATIEDSNYAGAAMGTLAIDVTALVRHAPAISGGLDGSLQLLSGETVTLAGTSWISGDLLVPGTPELRQAGNAKLLGVKDASGAATPSDYEVRLSGSALLRHLVRRVDPIPMPAVVAQPGTTNLAVASGASTTLAGGAYGQVTVSGELVLGAEGPAATEYDFGALVLGGNGSIKVVGPVVVRIAQGGTWGARIGDPAHPDWLVLNIANGGATLNGNAEVAAKIVAPSGTVTLTGNATLTGSVVADRLVISGNAALQDP